MDPIALVQTTPVWVVAAAVVLGLLVGSFLNVIIYRLPKILQRDWEKECRLLLEYHDNIDAVPQIDHQLNLCWPDSHCPLCKNHIPFYHNIPVLSYLILRGKCQQCKGKISARYPIVELISAVLSGFLAWNFGLGPALYGSLLFTWFLIPLFFIDLDHQLLPDTLTLGLLWLGLLFNINYTFASLSASVLGAVIAYLFLWSVFWIFKLITKKEGMGYGDFKLLAALAAWTGWQYLLILVLLSGILGLISGVIIALVRRHSLREAMPYGPALTLAGWITLIFGPAIVNWYWQISGVTA